jgi:hypothetical protein
MKYNLTYTHFDELLASSVNPFPVEKQTYFLTRIYEALDAITAEPDIENWRTLADVINLIVYPGGGHGCPRGHRKDYPTRPKT